MSIGNLKPAASIGCVQESQTWRGEDPEGQSRLVSAIGAHVGNSGWQVGLKIG